MPVIAASPSAEVERYQNTITGTSGRRSGVYPLASCAVLLVFCNDNNIYRWLSESCAPVRFIHFLTTWQSVKPNRLLHKVVWRQLRHGDTGHLALFITITRCTVSAKPGNTTNIHRRGWPAVMGSYPPWQSLNVPACWYVVVVLHDKQILLFRWQLKTVEVFHSRRETFLFCKSFPLQPFLFFFGTDCMIPQTVYCYFWAYPFFTF